MNSDLVVALIGFLGILMNVLTTNSIVKYRVGQLERKVEKHNNLVERMVAVEASVKSAHHRIDEFRVNK